VRQATAEAGAQVDPTLVTAVAVFFAVLGLLAALAMWWPELRRHIAWWRESHHEFSLLDQQERARAAATAAVRRPTDHPN
jgi:hypothetical protein